MSQDQSCTPPKSKFTGTVWKLSEVFCGTSSSPLPRITALHSQMYVREEPCTLIFQVQAEGKKLENRLVNISEMLSSKVICTALSDTGSVHLLSVF